MSTFDNISSIVSLEQLNNNSKINKNYVILFFYMNGCSHCEKAKPIVCKIIQNNLPKNSNCEIVKVHINDIKDDDLNKLYNGGVPAFRILKHTYNGYVLFDHENIQLDGLPANKKYSFTIDGFANMDYINERVKHLSTENTLLNWIENLNKLPIEESYTTTSIDTNFSRNIVKEGQPIYYDERTHRLLQMDRFADSNTWESEDDGSGYTIIQKNYSQKPFHKSLNKIINENIKNIERYYH